MHSSADLARINWYVFVDDFYFALVFVYLEFYNFTVAVWERSTSFLMVLGVGCDLSGHVNASHGLGSDFYRSHSKCYVTF